MRHLSPKHYMHIYSTFFSLIKYFGEPFLWCNIMSLAGDVIFLLNTVVLLKQSQHEWTQQLQYEKLYPCLQFSYKSLPHQPPFCSPFGFNQFPELYRHPTELSIPTSPFYKIMAALIGNVNNGYDMELYTGLVSSYDGLQTIV